MTLPVQPAPHIASGRPTSSSEDDIASPRAYPGDLIDNLAGIKIQNKDTAISCPGLPSDRDISRPPIRRNQHGMGVPTRRDLSDSSPL
jgi:hypothetical protein